MSIAINGMGVSLIHVRYDGRSYEIRVDEMNNVQKNFCDVGLVLLLLNLVSNILFTCANYCIFRASKYHFS